LASAYLDNLNSEQRDAVDHGIGAAGYSGPLLVIAGAGSGKTNTLAHQLAGFSGRPCLYRLEAALPFRQLVPAAAFWLGSWRQVSRSIPGIA
jgi:hypothetical protein